MQLHIFVNIPSFFFVFSASGSTSGCISFLSFTYLCLPYSLFCGFPNPVYNSLKSTFHFQSDDSKVPKIIQVKICKCQIVSIMLAYTKVDILSYGSNSSMHQISFFECHINTSSPYPEMLQLECFIPLLYTVLTGPARPST